MRIAILGATGSIGQRVTTEGLARGHEITGIARRQARVSAGPALVFRCADGRDLEQLEAAVRGHDAIVSALGPREGEPPSTLVDASRVVAAACMRAGVKRVIVVNGAGSLFVEPGLELLHTEGFPTAWREIALAHREALQLWRKVKELDWTVVSPAASVTPGARTGRYRTGHDDLLRDGDGQSRISMEDLAVAIVDELEHGAHVRERITFAH